MSELLSLPNIGAELNKQLNSVGITTLKNLKETGSREAWWKIFVVDPSACYNRLCALEGALQGVRWHDLSEETKKKLKAFYNEVKTGVIDRS